MNRDSYLAMLCLAVGSFLQTHFLVADEIGFIEKFALATDREAVLKELVPGTEDYYYFHCLHYQNTEQFAKVDQMLDRWIKSHDYQFRATQRISARAREIVNRQMLLTYSRNPQQSLGYLETYLRLKFNHQQETIHGSALPSLLDPDLISRARLTEQALARHSNLQGFEQSATRWLLDTKLSRNDLYYALTRVQVPDHPKLVSLVNQFISDDGREFGKVGIHLQLTKPQLLALAKLKPRLMNNGNFVNVYLSKVRPNPDVDFDSDRNAQEAHLNELWEFVEQLSPAFNSLKAHVLYRRLKFDRSIGVYSRQRFLEYIKLPREASYIEAKYHRQREFSNYKINFNQNFQKQTLYSNIGNDEPLIRSYLHHFFITDADYKRYEAYLHYSYLKRHFAEAKIVNGLGDPEKWADYISAPEYKDLRNRVDIDFAYTSKADFDLDSPVTVEVNVKNVQKLIVKVFEINTANFYRDRQMAIDTNIELDGLLPNKEYTFQYDESPFRRVTRQFQFDELDHRGVYVIDFIGNRKSSRALVRKGQLRYLEKITAAGHELRIVNENNQPVPDATVWLAGANHRPAQDGTITIPFSNRPGRYPLVISQGDSSSLDFFNHQAESYRLHVGFHVDRESLLAGETAKVIVRPQLTINGIPASLSLLTDVRLVINSVDLDGSVATKQVNAFELFEDRESHYEFQVPKRLQGLTFTLSAQIKNLSQGKTVSLVSKEDFHVNQIDTDVKVEDLHLSKIGDEYFLDLLGKNGELKVGRSIQLTLKHRDFREPVNVALQTNMQGRIKLGKLKEIATLSVAGPEGTTRQWNLIRQSHTYLNSMFASEGETIEIPVSMFDQKLTFQDVSLMEMRSGTHYRNAFEHMKLSNGLLKLSGLSRGDYRLIIKNVCMIHLKIAQGKKVLGFAVSGNRQLELKSQKPIQVSSIDRNKESTVIQLTNADRFTRVHVVATRYVPRFDMFRQLELLDFEPGLTTLPKSKSLYVAGRKIGDEYQYILDRKYAEKFPGVMLQRPGMLLQPWAVRTTQTSRQAPKAGTEFDPADDSRVSNSARGGKSNRAISSNSDPANLNFLTSGSIVLLNLKPDKNGRIVIDNDLFGNRQHIHVCAVTPNQAAARDVSFAEVALEPTDQRFVLGLDPDKRYARKKEITFVDKEDSFEITDVATGEFELVDNLPSVYRLFVSLTNDPKLNEFRFILTWKDKKLSDKLELYSKYACHELNFFLYKKDPKFFDAVVAPYLQNKKDKTFLDRWLLKEDLSSFTEPWEFNQLNTVERILLSRVLRGEGSYTSRWVRESYDLAPTTQERFDRLFGFAVQGNALETERTAVDKEFGLIQSELADKLSLKPSNKNIKELNANGRIAGGRGRGSFGDDDSRAMPQSSFQSGAIQDTKSGEKLAKGLRRQLQQEQIERFADRYKQNGVKEFYRKVEGKRKELAQLFRQVDKTQEWAENNYYKLEISKQNSELVQVNQLWRDFAEHANDGPFYSVNVAEASHNFTEMMFALSVLDLDWEPGKHESETADNKLTLTAGSPLLVYHDQIRPAKDGRKETSVLVSQNFFQVNDRYRYEGSDRLDKFVTDEFIKRTAYGCQVVVTNPTSAKQKIDLLLQIPRGALPLKSTKETQSVHLELDPYRTSSIEYYFYFPEPGTFEHYPVNVARNEEVIAFAEPLKFNVVDQPSTVDKSSWAYISQFGTNAEVLEFLQENNLQRNNLDKIAWRMKDHEFYNTVVDYLSNHHVYHSVLWAYGVNHNEVRRIRELLNFNDSFVNQTGPYLDSTLLTNDRVARKTYEHLEYSPLVNARVHQLGQQRQILNDRFLAQYRRLLWILGCKRKLSDQDRMALSYYLILQDRLSEGQRFFQDVSVNSVKTRIQYDYMAAYYDMLNESPKVAQELATKYAEYPVQRWRKAFQEIANQINEINGKATLIVDQDSRENVQDQNALKTASFDFKVDAKHVELNFQNLQRVQVNYYVMDVELLFSRNPFVKQYSGELTYIRPKASMWIELPKSGDKHKWSLPKELDRSNVLVEIAGGNQVKSQAYYAHAMNVQMIESYGQLMVVDAKTGKRVPRTYCKVYAQMKDGTTRFYKDGYTDLRGRFDYTSLSTNDLDHVNRFSVLVMSDELGATVREAIPPKR